MSYVIELLQSKKEEYSIHAETIKKYFRDDQFKTEYEIDLAKRNFLEYSSILEDIDKALSILA